MGVRWRAMAAVCLGAMAAASAGGDEVIEDAGADGFALVELYTSEGCSSCPPADELAANISRRAELLGERVYVVSFHVDYWDRLGWPDRFADEAYTARQRAYAEAFENRNVYTPQVVVNGTTEFVGSRRAQADEAIEAALGGEEGVGVEVRVDGVETAALTNPVTCVVTGIERAAMEGLVVHAALVEDGLSTIVKRGENAGRTLVHEDVVRWLGTKPLTAPSETRFEMRVPRGVSRERSSVVAWVQEGETGRVLGVGRGRFQPVRVSD